MEHTYNLDAELKAGEQLKDIEVVSIYAWGSHWFVTIEREDREATIERCFQCPPHGAKCGK